MSQSNGALHSERATKPDDLGPLLIENGTLARTDLLRYRSDGSCLRNGALRRSISLVLLFS